MSFPSLKETNTAKIILSLREWPFTTNDTAKERKPREREVCVRRRLAFLFKSFWARTLLFSSFRFRLAISRGRYKKKARFARSRRRAMMNKRNFRVLSSSEIVPKAIAEDTNRSELVGRAIAQLFFVVRSLGICSFTSSLFLEEKKPQDEKSTTTNKNHAGKQRR